MARKTTTELERLDLPAEEGVRVVALARIAEVDLAAARLAGGDDGEALHDFRVGLRRLRTSLRSFRPWLEGGPKRKHERAVGDLARTTNAARDAEVQLAWLTAQRERIPAEKRTGLEWLVASYERRRLAGQDLLERLERWRALSQALRERLRAYRRTVRPLSVEPIGRALAGLLRKELAAFRQALAAVAGPDDVKNAHRARIRAKRLRYLLEPLRGYEELGAREAVRTLKDLQDVLGELHDAHVLLSDAAAARTSHAPGERPPALANVTRLARSRRDKLHQRLVSERADGPAVVLATQVDLLATALEARRSTVIPERPARRKGARPSAARPKAEDEPDGRVMH